jgi:hypothetical protein
LAESRSGRNEGLRTEPWQELTGDEELKLSLGARIAAAVSPILAAMGLGFVLNFDAPTQPRQPFDASQWRAQGEQLGSAKACLRGGMSMDLVDGERLVGLSQAQVEDLLGPPTHRDAGTWRYALGRCVGFGWRDSDLQVVFDAKAVAASAVIGASEPAPRSATP